MNTIQVVGIIAGACTSISLLPQLIKTIKEKKGGDISYSMLAILLVGLGLWIWYGVLKKDYPIIITNTISVILNTLIIVFNIYYRKAGS
jgi:MtN3 and saliva related transmembrane protein